MSAWRIGWLLISVALVACDDDGKLSGVNVASEQERATEARQPMAARELPQESPPQEAEDASPIDERLAEPVAVALNSQLGSDRRMYVTATTNLPAGTRVQLRVVREASNVRWQSRTQVTDGAVSAGPYGPGSGLPDGYYRIEFATAPADVQPAAVKASIGERGRYLSGPLVVESEHGLGKLVEASERFLVGQEVRRTLDDVEVQQQR